MRSGRGYLAGVAAAGVFLLWPSAIGVADEPISVPSGFPEWTARQVAGQWVFYMRGGHTPAACRLQIVQEVEGQPCGSLPPIAYSCPKQNGPLPEIPARSASRQIGAVQQIGSEAAVAWIKSAPTRSHYSVALTLQYSDGAWRIDSVLRGSRVVTPAGSIVSTTIVSRLLPGCVRLAVNNG
jgi:hypothetical protein